MDDTLKPGDVVRATKFIVDADHHGNPYLHAVPGDYGVVDPADFDPIFPNIRWGRCGEGGICNVSPDAFVKVISGVWYAVDGIGIDS